LPPRRHGVRPNSLKEGVDCAELENRNFLGDWLAEERELETNILQFRIVVANP
jgi:hypothetical protein